MDNIALARRLVDTDAWQPLLNHLADDVVFKVTVPDGTPISGELRGKQAVVDHLTNLGDLLAFRQEKPPEFFGADDRVVVLGQETVEVKKSGVTVAGSEYATVLDFRYGLIARFLVIQDLSAFVDAYRSNSTRAVESTIVTGHD